MPAELVLHKVDKVYRSRRSRPVHAVKDLNLTVKPGEITALLGSSGCGKTSTLRMIAGFEDVSNGSISLDGRPIHNLPPSARRVAMAFESYSLYPPLTIGENIAFALKSSRLATGEAGKRVRAMAELLEIGDILGKYPSSVSGGQQQRASLGRALVRGAGLYLLDEPMGQLEPQLRAVLRGRIKHYLREHGLTVILVTHDQTEANALADRIAVMEDGILQQYATPAELKARPANLFTGTFIGEPPMNVFPAAIRRSAKRIAFHLEDSGAAFDFPLKDLSPAVRQRIDGMDRITLGVRPHALRIASSGIAARIGSNQWLGDQSHLALDVAGRTAVAVLHERLAAQAGVEVNLAVAAADLHLFHAETGIALAHGGEAA